MASSSDILLRHLIKEIVNDNSTSNRDCKDCVGCQNCNHCIECSNCKECIDCINCFSCTFCRHCIDCSGQSGASYMINNQQYSQEEYFKLAKPEWARYK